MRARGFRARFRPGRVGGWYRYCPAQVCAGPLDRMVGIDGAGLRAGIIVLRQAAVRPIDFEAYARQVLGADR
jgi:hypothetical protein